eukprot:3278723-Prymnesium_polylepis.1
MEVRGSYMPVQRRIVLVLHILYCAAYMVMPTQARRLGQNVTGNNPQQPHVVQTGVLMPVFGTKAAGYPRLPWSPLDS